VATGVFDLRGAGSAAVPADGALALRWPSRPGSTDTVESDLGWALKPWAGVPVAAGDLLKVATGAYLADALTPRGVTFTRDIALTVAVTDPGRWTDGLADDACDLLYWLTGDQWQLSVVPDDTAAAGGDGPPDPPSPTPVSLLSGGLDSLMGAVFLLHQDPAVQFLGHKDAAKAIRASQNAVGAWLARSYAPTPPYTRVALKHVGAKRERSSRSRSLLFMSLGISAASSRGATTLYVPENGYTSLNVPLHPNRAGALSTRSTHPMTFDRMNALLVGLGLDVAVANPFEAMTKGEVMMMISDLSPPEHWLDAAAVTLSCGKLDGARIPGGGGNPNLGCGLCVPCLVRRGTFIAAGQPDRTRYLVNEMTGSGLAQLVRRRQDDIDAVRYGTARPVDEDLIDSQTWPDGYDLDAASALVQRGLDELAAVPLP
jgi:7-cyano-7-deazaguanine synthase in queuosine biosynthesis